MSQVPKVPKRRGGTVLVIVAAVVAALSTYVLLDSRAPSNGADRHASHQVADGGLDGGGERAVAAEDGRARDPGPSSAELGQGERSQTHPASDHTHLAGAKTPAAKKDDPASGRREGHRKSPPPDSTADVDTTLGRASEPAEGQPTQPEAEAEAPTPSKGMDEPAQEGHEHAHAAATPQYMPPVDKSTIPKDGWVGLDHVVVWDMPDDPKDPNYNENNAPNYHPDDGAGAFRTLCRFSHMMFDDPIVFPRQPGKSHLHIFYGNTGANAASTVKSIAGSGRSTCRGGIMNLTSYWVPAMVEEDTGKVIHPPDLQVYYKSGYLGVKPADIQPMPNGLRMIAGGYMDGRVGKAIVRFECKGRPATRARTIPACRPGEILHIALDFPQCWDGKNLDSPDHRSHVIHATGRGCPATHPVPIPVITYNLDYEVGPGGSGKWRLVSDMYDPAKPPGLSMHGDWFMGWDEKFRDEWLENCVKPGRDCHGHLVGPFRKTGF